MLLSLFFISHAALCSPSQSWGSRPFETNTVLGFAYPPPPPPPCIACDQASTAVERNALALDQPVRVPGASNAGHDQGRLRCGFGPSPMGQEGASQRPCSTNGVERTENHTELNCYYAACSARPRALPVLSYHSHGLSLPCTTLRSIPPRAVARARAIHILCSPRTPTAP